MLKIFHSWLEKIVYKPFYVAGLNEYGDSYLHSKIFFNKSEIFFFIYRTLYSPSCRTNFLRNIHALHCDYEMLQYVSLSFCAKNISIIA